jgi:hypothetical protein
MDQRKDQALSIASGSPRERSVFWNRISPNSKNFTQQAGYETYSITALTKTGTVEETSSCHSSQVRRYPSVKHARHLKPRPLKSRR